MSEEKSLYQSRIYAWSDREILGELPRIYDLNKLTAEQFGVLQHFLTQWRYLESLNKEAHEQKVYLSTLRESSAPSSVILPMQERVDETQKEIDRVSNKLSSYEQEYAPEIKSLLRIGYHELQKQFDSSNNRVPEERRNEQSGSVQIPSKSNSAPAPTLNERPNIRKESVEAAVKRYEQQCQQKTNVQLRQDGSSKMTTKQQAILFFVGLFLFFLIGFIITRCDGQSTVEPVETVSETDAAYKEGNYYIRYSAKCVTNDSVGNEWGYGLMYDGEEYESRSHITITNTTSISIRVFATEYDSDDDYGSAQIYFDSLVAGETATKEATVTVRENKGRYKGNKAVWEFTVTLERCDRDEMQEHSHNSDPKSDNIESTSRNKSSESSKKITVVDVLMLVVLTLLNFIILFMAMSGIMFFLYACAMLLIQYVTEKVFKAKYNEQIAKVVIITIFVIVVLTISILSAMNTCNLI